MKSGKEELQDQRNEIINSVITLFDRLDVLESKRDEVERKGWELKAEKSKLKPRDKDIDFHLKKLGRQAFFEKIIFKHTDIADEDGALLNIWNWAEKALNANEIPRFISKDDALDIIWCLVEELHTKKLREFNEKAKVKDEE